MFTHALVINLDHRPDRLELVGNNLQQQRIDWQRFSAVGVKDLADDQPSEALKAFLHEVDGPSPRAEHKLMTTWACMRSHLGAIRTAQAAGWSSVLILEDDCDFEPYTHNVLRRVSQQLQGREWDMLYLGGTLKRGGVNEPFSTNLKRVSRVRLAHAYVVHERLYDRILSEAPASGLPIDWYYSEVLQPSVTALAVTPKLAYQRLGDMSDIEQVERVAKRKSRQRLLRWWARVRYGSTPE